jgi:hypothetical protein
MRPPGNGAIKAPERCYRLSGRRARRRGWIPCYDSVSESPINFRGSRRSGCLVLPGVLARRHKDCGRLDTPGAVANARGRVARLLKTNACHAHRARPKPFALV